jgi:hypothetical protein
MGGIGRVERYRRVLATWFAAGALAACGYPELPALADRPGDAGTGAGRDAAPGVDGPVARPDAQCGPGPMSGFALLPGRTAVFRTEPSSLVVGSNVYLLGGQGTENNVFGAMRSVESAVVQADGSLATFAESSTPLSTARHGHAAVVVVGNANQRSVYVIGGSVASGQSDVTSVERSSVGPGGVLAGFANAAGVTLVTARNGHTATVVGKRVYVVGGYSSNTGAYLSSVESATIASDGSLGTFSTVSGVVVGGLSLGTGRGYHTAAVIGRYLYVFGGATGPLNNTTMLSTIERAPINPDDTLGPFAQVPNFQLGRGEHATEIVGSSLYVIGGCVFLPGRVQAVDKVERATVNADGSLGPFEQLPGTLDIANCGGVSASINGSAYYFLGTAIARTPPPCPGP